MSRIMLNILKIAQVFDIKYSNKLDISATSSEGGLISMYKQTLSNYKRKERHNGNRKQVYAVNTMAAGVW